ncbi:hypothetical protein E9549_08115 [Blastococcus sp. MG754426]|uniref:hypothetical protein n=1 Tax=unclassified Blastococcus TaxID=2619396 RepID=UPI001EF0172B|nr:MULTISPECIES: hypothetical protein [unclassified Blastococcus]MCF6507371.1 hypothetical protein [Blastococcus sp. MG754426]MCF6511443.1 hypothetical protein [Blastococcus sp. MG754427]
MTANVRRNGTLLLLAALLAMPMLSACGGDADAETSGTVATKQLRLTGAHEECKRVDRGSTLSLEDDGNTIVIDTGSEYGDPSGYLCVIEQLDVPSSITAQMDRTNAMMGVQQAEHNGYEFSWSYHPDNGVNMVISDTRATEG